MLGPRRAAPPPFPPARSLHTPAGGGVLLLGALYLWGTGSARRRFGPVGPVPPWRRLSFAAGLLVILGALDGPIHDLSDYYLFWVHMGQHLLLTLVLPPLLLAGVPAWLVEPALRRK